MYHILIYDSIQEEGEEFLLLCNDVLNKYHVQVQMECFTNGYELLHKVQTDCFNILFLNITHQPLHVLSIAKQIRLLHLNQNIVFISNTNHYLKEALELHAFQYLQFPILTNQLESVFLDDYILRKEPPYLIIQKREQCFRIPIRDIIYIESDRMYIIIHLSKHTYRHRLKLNDVLQFLTPHNFIRCHQSFILNMMKVSYIERYYAITSNNIQIPISKAYTKKVRLKFQTLYEDYFL